MLNDRAQLAPGLNGVNIKVTGGCFVLALGV